MYIFPTPRKQSFGKQIKIGYVSNADFHISSSQNDALNPALKYIENAFNLKAAILPPYEGSFEIKVAIDEYDKELAGKGDEAYRINVKDSGALLIASNPKGAYYAAITFEKLLTVDNDEVYLNACDIVDYPKLARRGVFIESRFNDFMTLDDWKDAIDYYSEMKLNTMIISVYGCWGIQFDRIISEYAYIPLKSVPEFKTPKPEKYYSVKRGGWVNIPPRPATMQEEDYLKEVIRYGKTKNVEVFPLFNSLGHNTLLPRIFPEISAKNEDGSPRGFGVCLSDPKSIDVITKIHNELIDEYLIPTGATSIHLGLDEAVFKNCFINPDGSIRTVSPICDCAACRSKKSEDMLIDYVVAVVKNAKARGMKNIYIYHDAFIHDYPASFDGAAKRFNVMNEALADRFKAEGIYDETVIEWWNYSAGEKFLSCGRGAITKSFRKVVKPMSGYECWSNFVDTTPNIFDCATLAEELNFEGMISYTNYERMYDLNYRYLAEAAWNNVADADLELFNEKYFTNAYPENTEETLGVWRKIRQLVRPYNYDKDYPSNGEFIAYIYGYLNPEISYPRDFLAEVMTKIHNNPEKYLSYLKLLRESAGEALDFCLSDKATPSEINENFTTSFMNLYTSAEIFLTLSALEDASASGKLSADLARAEFARLINLQKRLILSVENTRLASTRHHHLRLASIMLTYLSAFYDKFKAFEKEKVISDFYLGESVADRTSPTFEFLR